MRCKFLLSQASLGIIFFGFLLSGCESGHHSKTSGQPGTSEPKKKVFAPVKSEAYLRKLSFHLRGFNPSEAEYAALAKAKEAGRLTSFLAEKREEYFRTDFHIEKMNNRVNDLLQFRSDHHFPEIWPAQPMKEGGESGDFTEDSSVYKTKNSANFLIRSMIRNNQSWDQLLLGRDYRIFNMRKYSFQSRSNETIDDVAFIRGIHPEGLPKTVNDPARSILPKPEDGINHVDIGFSDAEPQVAGIISTSRFFNRYPTTGVNKNRKRAAALFRMFLCDELLAVSVDQKNNKDPIFDLIFPELKGGQSVTPQDVESQHGDDPACAKCHYKLDPVGQVFSSSPFVLSPRLATGALVFRNSKENLVSVQVKGLRELAKAIQMQPEYVSCQVTHFWNWFLGTDVELSNTRKNELVAKFDEVGRRPNDFISYLVDSPEFWSSEQEVEVGEDRSALQAVLTRCDLCHRSDAKKIPELVNFAKGGSSDLKSEWLEKMRVSLDLDGDGSKAKMPPKNSAWKLSKGERDLIANWIKEDLKLVGGEK